MKTEMFTYHSECEPMRLDLFISGRLEGETRASVQRLIEAGNVLVDGHPVRSSLKLKGGEAGYGRRYRNQRRLNRNRNQSRWKCSTKTMI